MKVFLDDTRVPSEVHGEGANDEWILTSSVAAVKEYLRSGNVTHLSLDNDLGYDEPEGHTVVKWMIDNNIWPTEEIYVHSANIVRATQMRADINRYYYRCVKVQWERERKSNEQS